MDSHINRFYFGPGGDSVGLYVGFYKSQQTGETIHSPKNCLPGTGWQPLKASKVLLRMPNGGTYTVNQYIVENKREKLLVLYWYQSHGPRHFQRILGQDLHGEGCHAAQSHRRDPGQGHHQARA